MTAVFGLEAWPRRAARGCADGATARAGTSRPGYRLRRPSMVQIAAGRWSGIRAGTRVPSAGGPAAGQSAGPPVPGRERGRRRPGPAHRRRHAGLRGRGGGDRVVHSTGGATRSFEVRPGYGHKRATATRDGVLQMPRWARREMTILHEVAHCLTPEDLRRPRRRVRRGAAGPRPPGHGTGAGPGPGGRLRPSPGAVVDRGPSTPVIWPILDGHGPSRPSSCSSPPSWPWARAASQRPTPTAPAVPPEATVPFTVTHDVRYGTAGGQDLLLDAYVPDDTNAERVAVVLIHGGGLAARATRATWSRRPPSWPGGDGWSSPSTTG